MRPGKHIFLLLYIFSSLSCFAQLEGEARTDSMVKALAACKEDTNKVNLLNKLAYTYHDLDPGKGLKYAEQELALATRLGWQQGIGYAHMSLGLSYQNKNEYELALKHHNIALGIFQKIGFQKGAATVLGNIGVVYSVRSDYPNAEKYYRKQLELAKATNNKKEMAFAIGQLGNMLNHQGKYDSAITYYKQAIKLQTELGKKKLVALNLMNLGTIYNVQSELPKALEYYLEAKKIYEELDDKSKLGSIYNNIGTIYVAFEKEEKAMEYFVKALKLNEETDDKMSKALSLVNIGSVYHERKDIKNALKYYSASLDLCEEIGDIEGVAWASGSMAEIFSEQHDPIAGITYCNKALKTATEIGEARLIASLLRQKGSAYLALAADSVQRTGSREYLNREFVADANIPRGKNERIKEAIKYFGYALDSAKRLKSVETIYNCYVGMSNAYRLSGDYKRALEYSDLLHAYSDTFYNKDSAAQVVEIMAEHQYEMKHFADSMNNLKKQAYTDVKLQRQRAYTITGIALAGMLTLVSLVVVRNNKKLENERHRSDDLLLNILPTEVAKELKDKGEANTQYHEHVTILFTDFVSFTKSAQKMSPDALIEELHFCFKKFDEITTKYRIEKIKTIGDAYLAVAGLPLPDEQHATNAVRAAIEIRDFMKERYAHLGNRSFEIRIGIHTGSVVAGIVGVKKFAYDIWGDAVNTAARMEQNSEPGQINISESTYELVKDKFTCSYRGELEAKNKGLMKMYFVS